MTTVDEDVRDLVTMIRAQFGLPNLPVHLTRLLAAGEPVTVERAAAAGGWSVAALRTELARHPGTDWDDEGRIVGFGLTLRPTRHTFTFDGTTRYAFCASDTLEFPAILNTPGVVESTCPATGRRIRVELGLDQVVAVDPPNAVVSRVRPSHAVNDIRAQICALGSFFSSPEAAADWLAHNPEGTIAPIEQDFQANQKAMTELGWTNGPAPS